MVDETAATTTQEPAQPFKAAAEAVEKPAETTATDTPVEAEAAVTGEGAEEPTPPASREEIEQTERFGDALKEIRATAIEDARADIHREAKSDAYKDLQSRFQADSNTLTSLHQATQAMSASWQDVLDNFESQGSDPKVLRGALARVLRDHPGWAEAVNGSYYGKGSEDILTALANEAGDPMLLGDFYAAVQNKQLSERQRAVEFLDRLTEARMRDRIKEERVKAVQPKDEEIAKLTAQVNQLKGKSREEGPEKLLGSAGGGVEEDNRLLLDPNTPMDKIREIRSRQRLAG